MKERMVVLIIHDDQKIIQRLQGFLVSSDCGYDFNVERIISKSVNVNMGLIDWRHVDVIIVGEFLDDNGDARGLDILLPKITEHIGSNREDVAVIFIIESVRDKRGLRKGVLQNALGWGASFVLDTEILSAEVFVKTVLKTYAGRYSGDR